MNDKKSMSDLVHGVKERVLRQASWAAAVDVSGLSDADSILQRSHSNYVVKVGRLALADLDGNVVKNIDGSNVLFNEPEKRPRKKQMPGPLPDQILSEPGGNHAVVRIDPDGLITPFAIRGTQYTVLQNEEIVKDALAIAAEADNFADVMYAGNDLGGRVFFTGMGFTPLVINFDTFVEKFDRHLIVYSGHDGELAYRVGWRFDDADAPGVIQWESQKKKHYSGVKANVAEANRYIKKMNEISDKLVDEVRELADVHLPAELESTQELIDKCSDEITKCTTNKFYVVRDNKQKLRNLYLSFDFSGRRGFTGWALYRACMTLDEDLRMGGRDSSYLQLMTAAAYGEARRKVRQLILEAKGN
jgi:hypothetical protein